ncbi:MAG: hypothetical protein V4623_08255 [Pseudomonadota bacterium]
MSSPTQLAEKLNKATTEEQKKGIVTLLLLHACAENSKGREALDILFAAYKENTPNSVAEIIPAMAYHFCCANEENLATSLGVIELANFHVEQMPEHHREIEQSIIDDMMQRKVEALKAEASFHAEQTPEHHQESKKIIINLMMQRKVEALEAEVPKQQDTPLSEKALGTSWLQSL